MKDILIRAGKTFIQAFLGSLAITLPNCDFTDSIKISANGFDSITFSDIVNRMEKYATDDELLSAFIHFLQKHQ